ncbi:endonuclease/exonuclease/phosphatase family protein [Gregarina niphandrodes]|uniref:Endonuclease/exonuclease/phosphatase family protein n=1 Tax=Gregarina niphandrodes TaxID=110365 RepID=A0A023AWY0_GRENI|nr:endonuclease/exonuclease/phosphatase family protein [Gregarina niphandrodes]EZG43087.1 endonuclease/exonuclease/phosphatase family protein [Gregarina niphandrodes]|eukprot:XP_011134679.1 endonuclease/exonuclease/phosphatase family protein [Gregarina niphandrodes]
MAINVDGYSNKKELQLRNIVLNTRPHIVILSETCTDLHRTIYNNQYTVIGAAGPSDGVAAMIRQDVQYSISSKTTRIIVLQLDNLVTCIGTYGPTEQTADKQKAKYWEYLAKLIPTDKPLLIAGDLNSGHEPTQLRTITGIPNYIRLQRLTDQHGLNILPTAPTWISKRSKDQKPSRTLDRILINTTAGGDDKVILDWENAPADHAVLTYKWTLHTIDYNQGRPRNIHSVRDSREQTTQAWMRFRERLRLHFRKQKPLLPRQQNANQRLWEQYRKLKGEEGLTLIDETEVEQGRRLIHTSKERSDSISGPTATYWGDRSGHKSH